MKRFKILKVKKAKNTVDEPENIFDLMNQEETAPKEYMDAVKDISFSLKTNECFILLGVNGAGKSTTFKCLTVEEEISSG
jgi:ATP-binding cassette subfamily A (ABC1) protein 3